MRCQLEVAQLALPVLVLRAEAILRRYAAEDRHAALVQQRQSGSGTSPTGRGGGAGLSSGGAGGGLSGGLSGGLGGGLGAHSMSFRAGGPGTEGGTGAGGGGGQVLFVGSELSAGLGGGPGGGASAASVGGMGPSMLSSGGMPQLPPLPAQQQQQRLSLELLGGGGAGAGQGGPGDNGYASAAAATAAATALSSFAAAGPGAAAAVLAQVGTHADGGGGNGPTLLLLASLQDKARFVLDLLQQLRVSPAVADAAVAAVRPALRPWLDLVRARQRKAAAAAAAAVAGSLGGLSRSSSVSSTSGTVAHHPYAAGLHPNPAISPIDGTGVGSGSVGAASVPRPGSLSGGGWGGSRGGGGGAAQEATHLLPLYGALCECAAVRDGVVRDSAVALLQQVGRDVGLLDAGGTGGGATAVPLDDA